jgi:hypothetical protein
VGTLGAGSQGETLEAVDKREGRPVAIKRFTIRGAKSWKDVELAEREATVLASLHHPGLPHYIEHFEENGALYLVMEKIDGETLQSRRKRGAGLDQAQVLRLLRETADCLRYLHGQAPPVVHRDIKPGNVILRPDGSYCLVDFGSVRDRLKPEGGSTVVGTFGFMPPEQFQGRAGPSSDVYAVGATALSLLTGREPEDLPHKGLGVDVESALRGQFDRRLISALRHMLEPDPDKRARSVDDALRAAGLSESARVEPPQPGSAAEAKAARRERLRERFHEIEDEQRERRERRESHAERHARKRAEREERRARKFAEMVEQRVRRKAERAARRAERDFQRGWRPPGPPVPPARVLGAVILIALGMASVATFALFGIILPILFSIIYIPRTRQRMLEINAAGQRGLTRAREHIKYQFLGGQIPPELEQFLRNHNLDPEHVDPFARDQGQFGDRAHPQAQRQRVSIDSEAEELEPDDTEPQSHSKRGEHR